jgi:GNAT superfamily N-acetyltransferase
VIGESRIVLRTAGFEDAEQIAPLAAQLGYPSKVDQIRARMERIAAENLGRVIVAVDERGNVIGWTHVFVAHRMESEPFAEIGGLVVDLAHRNRGVGRILLEEAERWTMESGVTVLRVRSNMVRRDAHRFYERAGYSCQKTQGVFDKRFPRD